jgi:hypothetical protein
MKTQVVLGSFGTQKQNSEFRNQNSECAAGGEMTGRFGAARI